MSFIRCLNNPDRAYVYHSVSGYIYFTLKERKGSQKYAARMDNPFSVPAKVFYGLVKKFVKNYHQDCEYKGFSIKECDKFSKFLLTYNGRSIKLWQVTWEYIVRNVERHFMTKKEILRRRKMQENY